MSSSGKTDFNGLAPAEVIREKLLVLFDRFCVPLLGVVKRSSLRVSSHHLGGCSMLG